jgi:hypothetical protein
MAVTEDTFDVARGCRVADLYIGIPHQLPPRLWDATRHPPEEGDAYVRGDHDWHACLSLVNALKWKGHQWAKVQALAERTIREIDGGE